MGEKISKTLQQKKWETKKGLYVEQGVGDWLTYNNGRGEEVENSKWVRILREGESRQRHQAYREYWKDVVKSSSRLWEKMIEMEMGKTGGGGRIKDL